MAKKSKRNNFKRKITTFLRIFRYGSENFLRNAWLSLAAILVMTITLFIILMARVSINILDKATISIKDKVDMSIYFKGEIDDKTVSEIEAKFKNINNIREVRFVSSQETRKKFALENADKPEILEALGEANNKMPATFRVKVKNLDDSSQLESLVKNDKEIQKWIDQDRPPTFLSSGKETIDNISKSVRVVTKIGVGAAIIFTIIACLVMFNTIRMAIFNRKEEIYMMKLIGATNSFIRNPFIIESLLTSLVAAVATTILGVLAINGIKGVAVAKWLVDASIMDESIALMQSDWHLVFLSVFAIGIAISVVSSLLATRKYLKGY